MNKKKLNIYILGAITIAASSLTQAGPHWGYSGDNGPEHWGNLDPAYSTCATGKNQSPINISNAVDADLPDISVNYKPGGTEVVNNGHAIQVNYAPGSTMSVAGQTFELKQFHFHSPSENTIEGKSFAMEAHYVHADMNGNLAVVSVMFNEGKENPELAKAWAHMPASAGEKQALTSKIAPDRLLPYDRDYYRFNGSLTTPPCTEGVLWLVMEDASTASKAQIEKFTNTLKFDNNRPVQPVNARIVVED